MKEKEAGDFKREFSLSRPSFREAVREAARQIEIECFDEADKQFAREICFAIAEIYISRDDWTFYVDGEPVDAFMAREVFRELTAEHVRMVIRNFRKVAKQIQNKRAYLRTALYNAVFEMEADVQNTVARLMKGETS